MKMLAGRRKGQNFRLKYPSEWIGSMTVEFCGFGSV